jgi:uncharacterized membrane protein YfcA
MMAPDDGPMGATDLTLIAAVGLLAGIVNVVAGAGSLLSYPVLLAVGLPPFAADITNDLGVVPGNLSGVIGLWDSLGGQRGLLLSLVPGAAVSSLLGAALLLLLPGAAFTWVAPPLLLIASALTLCQPWLIAHTARRRGRSPSRAMNAAISLTALYGGYFGTCIGLMFMATLGAFIDDQPARLNALKTVLQLVSNGFAAVLFALLTPIHWTAVAAMATGALLGGRLGAGVARHLPGSTTRILIATIGIAASIWLTWQRIA